MSESKSINVKVWCDVEHTTNEDGSLVVMVKVKNPVYVAADDGPDVKAEYEKEEEYLATLELRFSAEVLQGVEDRQALVDQIASNTLEQELLMFVRDGKKAAKSFCH